MSSEVQYNRLYIGGNANISITMETNHTNKFSSNKCGRCGGDAPNWQCPKCGGVSHMFDPLHWQKCRFGAKHQPQCLKCREAEDNCTCVISA